MKKIVLLFFLMTGFLPIYSQNFEVGYYIKDGKKNEGFIKYESWLRTPHTIEFKASLNSTVELINAQSAEEFFVHDEVYISKKIDVKIDHDTPKEANSEIIAAFFRGDYFLRVFLKTPKIILFEFVDPKGKNHLFIEKDNIFQELFFSEDYHYENDRMFLTTKKGYVGQLRALFADCDKIKINDDFPYSKNDISKLCVSYLKCKDSESVSTIDASLNKNDKTRFAVGVIGGHYLNVDNPKNWLAGLSVRMSFPRNFNNTYLQVEGTYNNISNISRDQSIYYYPQPDDVIQVYNVSLLFGKFLGHKSFRPFFNAGMSWIGRYGGNGFLGAGLSWKRAVKIEYRESTDKSLRQIAVGYQYEF
ncbi:hypothetical protein VB264_00770 [Arcicella aquatica]|uniref:Uncharacterized protein n=1 Tax=Arcicella aquatica TaxID=217141 RepID=A0ABU5QII0_9BACT|nr:hypothetical protein [Arcicella aquatica]MEA5256296.1 hypothetical protein [Arcicella aquatica]